MHLKDVQALVQKALTGAEKAVAELQIAKVALQDEDHCTTLTKQLEQSGELQRIMADSLGKAGGK